MEQIVIIGLEMQFPVQDRLILDELTGMCQAAFFVGGLRPRVAEVDIDAVYAVLGCQNLGNALDIENGQADIVGFSADLTEFGLRKKPKSLQY